MAAAIVELNSLPDAIGAAAENHNFGTRRGVGLIFVFVGGIHVWGERFELGGASVDAFEDGRHTVTRALQTDGGGRRLPHLCQSFIAGTVAFYFTKQFFRRRFDGDACGAFVHGDEFFDLLDEPWIDLGEVADFFSVQAAIDRGEQPVDAIGARRGKFFTQQGVRRICRSAPGRVRLQGADRFLQRFLKSAADGHHFADRLHLCAKRAVRAGKFFELPFGNFGDYVIDGRFERGRRLFGYVVGNFVERHADGQARRDFCDRKAGGFAGQCGATRNAWIHFNHGHAAIFGINGELHVRAAGFNADFANNRRSGIAHPLIFLIRERLRGCDGDGVAGVNAHWIKILDGADDHEVVAIIPHHL